MHPPRKPLIVVGVIVVFGLASGLAVRGGAIPFVLNPSPSMPRGVYRIVPHLDQPFVRGESVLFPVPAPFRGLVEGRGWIAPGVPLMKTIGAVAGDRVCATTGAVAVNGEIVGPVLMRDRIGESLPAIRGCYVVSPGYFVPLSTYHNRSFDGRYIGPQRISNITAEVRPVWIF